MIIFSIVTAVKNNKDGLEKTISSIKSQDYPQIEYIVIDGASTDGTLDIINSNLDRIDKWRSEADEGLYYAMNKGKNMATGDFVIFINAGDTFISNTVISEIQKGMDENKNKLYHGKVIVYRHEIEREYKPHTKAHSQHYLPHHQATFYPASFYKKEDYDLNFKLCGDIDYTLRAIKKLEEQYIPITTIKSELGGFSTLLITTINGLKVHIKDNQYLLAKHPTSHPTIKIIVIYAKAIIKYIAFKTGGLDSIMKLTLR